MVAVALLQTRGQPPEVHIHKTMALAVRVACLESSVQKTAKDDYEAMGGFWSGIAPGMKNPTIYADFIVAQIKVRFPLIDFASTSDTMPIDVDICCVWHAIYASARRVVRRHGYTGGCKDLARLSSTVHHC